MAFKRKYKGRRRSFKRSRRGKFSRRGRSFQSRVAKVLMKKAETKYFDIAEENLQLYHNPGTNALALSSIAQLYNPWSDITQGITRQTRIGDKITPRGMSLKLWIANKLERPNIMYRIIIARAPKSLQGSLTTYQAYPFQTANLGSTGNNMLLPMDSDRGFKALYDRIYNTNHGLTQFSAVSGRECHMYKKLWIKRKNSRPIVYDGSGTFIVNNPLLIWIIPYDSYGTLTTDNIASCSYFVRMYYKDV